MNAGFTSAAGNSQTQIVIDVAMAFLHSLRPSQREQVQFAFVSQEAATAARFPARNGRMIFVGEQYGETVWSNFPVDDVPRPGLTLGSLSAAQRDAAMNLLQTLLSPMGFQKIIDIMGSDQVLSEMGTPYCSGIAYYTIGVFGTPSATTPWMLQFGGHHLGLNITIVGENAVLTPTLTGAHPALYMSKERTVRPLGAESDKAFALLNALDDSQREQALLNYRVTDLRLGPGHGGETLPLEGLPVSAINDDQQALLLSLISEWAGILHESYTAARMAEIEADLDDTYFAWSGQTTHEPGQNGSAYFCIHAPKLAIEFAPQGAGGDRTMHVHTMYRDPTSDYGRRLIVDRQ